MVAMKRLPAGPAAGPRPAQDRRAEAPSLRPHPRRAAPRPRCRRESPDDCARSGSRLRGCCRHRRGRRGGGSGRDRSRRSGRRARRRRSGNRVPLRIHPVKPCGRESPKKGEKWRRFRFGTAQAAGSRSSGSGQHLAPAASSPAGPGWLATSCCSSSGGAPSIARRRKSQSCQPVSESETKQVGSGGWR